MKKYMIIGTILILLGLGWFIYKQTTYTHIKVEFEELRPFEHRIPVYYKGIMIGRASERKHGSDFKHTYVSVTLYPKNLMLPVNTEVLLKKLKRNKKESDFIELIYPKEPSQELISEGCILKGKATVDFEEYMRNQHPDDIAIIKENLTNASANLNYSLEALAQLFIILQDTVKENQPNIKGTTGNLYKATSKISDSINPEQISGTFSNIEQMTSNLNDTTAGVNGTLPQINSTLKNAQDIVANTNAISCGIRQTLRKKFGGLRLMFGRTINEPECKACGQ